MDSSSSPADTFFDSYRRALLSRDVEVIAGHYACPALIAFPGRTLAVTDPQQTREFFASALHQYDGVSDATPQVAIMGSTPDSIWVDVTWDYGDAAPRERMCYQLLLADGEWRIGVLTPM